MPETDPSSAGTVARLERLERLANLEPGSVVPSVAEVAAVGDAAVVAEPASVRDAA